MPDVFHIDFDFSEHGPLFNGRFEVILDSYMNHTTGVLSEKAVSMLRAYLPTQYMYLGHNGGTPQFNPIPANAGELAASIHYDRVSDEETLVTDDPVTYGPWIEGVSSLNLIVWPHRRNPPPRRFPGYHAFRKIAQQLDVVAGEIATAELYPYLEEMQ